MKKGMLLFAVIVIVSAFITGCATSPEELARDAKNLKQMQSLEGIWRQALMHDKPSDQTLNFHYDFKLEGRTMVAYTVRDKDEGLGLKGDTYEWLRFTLNGRRLEGNKMFYKKNVVVRGVINESFNEIFWTWEEPGVTQFGEQAYFRETLRRE